MFRAAQLSQAQMDHLVENMTSCLDEHSYRHVHRRWRAVGLRNISTIGVLINILNGDDPLLGCTLRGRIPKEHLKKMEKAKIKKLIRLEFLGEYGELIAPGIGVIIAYDKVVDASAAKSHAERIQIDTINKLRLRIDRDRALFNHYKIDLKDRYSPVVTPDIDPFPYAYVCVDKLIKDHWSMRETDIASDCGYITGLLAAIKH